MKSRRDLTAGEVEALYQRLERRLERVGVETQPKVAAKVLELAQLATSQLADFAQVIKTDWALTGRILKLANSAYYAQRSPVTKLERALVLLGMERTKAVSLGFLLGRAAGGIGTQELARSLWGQSVYRASLCSALAASQCPHLGAEAFVVGLMLDSGVPLMARIFGDDYLKLYAQAGAPGKLLLLETEQLEFTHVDVFAVLARRWKLPGMIAKPVQWHHTLPPVGQTSDPVVLLHRLAYYSGALTLTGTQVPTSGAPLSSIASRLFEMDSRHLETVIRSASGEYTSLLAMFSDMADGVVDLENVAESVQLQLVTMMDQQMERSLKIETRGGTEKFVINGSAIEVEPGQTGEVVAYVSSDEGERVISCTVDPTKETPDTLAKLLGIDDAPAAEMSDLVNVMRSMAA